MTLREAGPWPMAVVPYTEVYEDVSGTLGFPQVLNGMPFRPVTKADLDPRFTRSTYWFRFTLENGEEDLLRIFLLAGSPRNEEIALYWQDGAGYRFARAGARVPAGMQPVPSRFPLFSIALPPSEQIVVYLRARSAVPLRLDPQVFSEATFLRAESRATFWNALLIGGLSAFSFCSLLIFFLSRMRSFGWLAALGTAVTCFEAAVRGYGKIVLWPGLAEWNDRSPTILGALIIVLFVAFGVSLARQENVALPAARVLKGLACVMAGVAVMAAFGELALAARLTLYGSAVFTVAKIWVAVVLVTRAVPSARLLLCTAAVALVHLMARLVEVPAALGWEETPVLGFDPDPLVALTSFAVNLALLAAWVAYIGKQRGAARQALAQWQVNEQTRLKEEVQRQTAALNEALKYAEKRNEERAHVLGYVSHDLRAPLATVAGYLKLLQADALPGQKGHLAAIERSLQYQNQLIRDILDFSRGELAPLALVPRPVDLKELLSGIADYGESLCRDTGNTFVASLDVDLSQAVMADGTRLQQVVLNLLRNAATYTSHGTVRLEAVARQVGQVCHLMLAVQDDGPGVSEADQERIFGRYQIGLASQGEGLGLYIVQHIVAAMDGEVLLSSTPGTGSQFSFAVTLAMDETPVSQLPPARPPGYRLDAERPTAKVFPVLPPPHLRMALAVLAREGRVTEIEAWAAAAEQHFPEAQAFVSAVRHALEVLDLVAIETMALGGKDELSKPDEEKP